MTADVAEPASNTALVRAEYQKKAAYELPAALESRQKLVDESWL
jgi:hypothetical protein